MKLKRILTLTLTAVMTMCVLFLVACGSTKNVQINFRDTKAVYRVGETIDLKDIVETEKGLSYSFSYSIDGGETVDVEARTLFAAKAGEYTINCKAINQKGKEVGNNSTSICVYDQEPLMFMTNTTYSFVYLEKYYLEKLIPLYDMFYQSEGDYEFIVDYCYHYKNPYVTEGVKIEFGETPSTGEYEGFYDGKDSVTFIKEGKYEFHLIMRNGGGEIDDTFIVTVRENFEAFEDLLNDKDYQGQYTLDYDVATGIASWTPFDGASWYKVKIDYETVYTQSTSLDIRPYFVPAEERDSKGNAKIHFQLFDFTVIPLDENKQPVRTGIQEDNVLGYKYQLKDFVVAPEQCGAAVLSKGTTVTEKDGIYTASLLGGKSRSKGWSTGVHMLDNNYVAWLGEYGTGTYVDFTFKGNNLPQMMFFADKVNGDMSMGNESDPNQGVFINNGMYCAIVDTSYQLFSADRITVWGPNRFYGSSSSTAKTWSGRDDNGVNHRIAHELTYPAFTQNYLMSKEVENTNFKYTVGTYEKGGLLWINMALYNLDNGSEISVAHIRTTLTPDKVKAGNIIAYASVKVDAEDSQFTFTKPYQSEPVYGSVYLGTVEKTGENTGNVLLNGIRPVHAGSGSGVGANSSIGVQDSYLLFKGNYGVGNYVEFTFKGNNMPYLNMFSNDIDGYLGDNGLGGTGLVLINGIVDRNNNKDANGNVVKDGNYIDREVLCDKLTVWGPNRYRAQSDGSNGTGDGGKPLLTFTYEDYPLLTQKGLKEDTSGRTYKYRVGTYYDAIGNLYLDITLSDASNNSVIYSIKEITGLSSLDIVEGNILALGCMKGENNPTEFSFVAPKLDKPDTETNVVARDAILNADSSVTLKGVRPVNSQGTKGVGAVGSIGKEDSYIAFKGDYGVGNYVEFTFSGNNMPYLNLFADTVDGWLGITDSEMVGEGEEQQEVGIPGKGIVIINGIVDQGNQRTDDTVNREIRCEEYNVWGPNRYTTTRQDGANIGEHKPLLSLSYSDYPLLTQKGLKEDTSGKTYKYKVGTYYDVIGNLILDIKLSDASNDQVIYDIQEVLELGTTEIGTGNIVALAPMKGLNQDSTFKFSAPVKEKSDVKPAITASGAAVNTDGSVTLTGISVTNGQIGTWKAVKNNYIGFDSLYGLGTYIDFYYTGDNVPYVTFFADQIDGCMNAYDSTGSNSIDGFNRVGIMIASGGRTYTTPGTSGAQVAANTENNLFFYGPYRYHYTSSYYTKYDVANYTSVENSNFTEILHNNAVDNKQYKLTYGMIDVDGSIYADIALSYLKENETEYTPICSLKLDTGVTVEEMKTALGITDGELKGKIIIYAAIKGAGNDTTFSFSQPYQPQQGE